MTRLALSIISSTTMAFICFCAGWPATDIAIGSTAAGVLTWVGV